MFQGEETRECVYSNRVNSEGLHSCELCNDLHHVLYPDCTNQFLVTDNEKESTMEMSKADDLILSPNAEDMDTAQSGGV